jgi:chromosome partitioning protein
VVDCDPQANATAGLGIVLDPARKNIYDVFMSRAEGFPQVPMSDIICSTESGIDLAPATLDLVGAEPYLYGIASRAEVLKDALWPVKQRYDLILIDTPPSMGQFVINGLVAADHIIVALDSGSFALNGVDPLLTIFGDIREDLGKDLRVDMAIISRWGEGGDLEGPVREEEKKTDLASWLRSLLTPRHEPGEDEKRAQEERAKEHERLHGILTEIEKKFTDVHTVPYSPEVYDAQKRGMPISHFAPGCSAGNAYKTIADEVLRWT